MPHSSGGGSHSGGSHSSSSHSSSSRSSFSSGGSHSGGYGSSTSYNSHRRSTSYFPHSTRYVYYYGNRPHYVYANYDITTDTLSKANKITTLILDLLPVFFVLFFAIPLIISGIDIPKQLHQSVPYEIVIEDRANVLDDTKKLEKSLSEFYDETGIAPAVITVNIEDYKNYYNALSNYAYDLYVNHFDDEEHWLIVYAEPKNPDPEFNDWYWEGMQGDDTDEILSYDITSVFNENLTKYLTAETKHSKSKAIQKAFDNLTPNIMDKRIRTENVTIGEVMVGIALLLAIPFIRHLIAYTSPKKKEEQKAIENAKKCPSKDKAKLITCDYCGGVYVEGTCLTCPHCGARVLSYEQFKAENNKKTKTKTSSISSPEINKGLRANKNSKQK